MTLREGGGRLLKLSECRHMGKGARAAQRKMSGGGTKRKNLNLWL